MKKGAVYFSLAIVSVITSGALLAWRFQDDAIRSIERASLPSPAAYEAASPATPTPTTQASPIIAAPPSLSNDPTPTTAPAPVAAAAEVNLAVPFTPQAPHANWEDPYGDFCEEASVLMAMQYIKGESIPSPNFADAEMQKIMQFENQAFGYNKDTNAAETARIITDYYKYPNAKVVPNPSVADLKQALAAKKVIIVPAAGRMLGNPYFQQPGPLYHMFVIKGYTADGKFIVNDPGTRRGADFLYSEQTVMNAMHDWRSDGQIELGQKAVIIVG